MDAYADNSRAKPLTHRETVLIVLGVLLPTFMGSLDKTILATALPTIGRDFGDVHNLPWLITAYLLAATAVIPLYGKIADIHGRRFTLRIAIADLYGRLARLRAGAEHAGADLRPRAARPRRRRALVHGHDRARATWSRPRSAAATTAISRSPTPPPAALGPAARRADRRASALVGDLLDQHSDGARGARDHRFGAAPAAALRAAAPARLRRRRADRDRQRLVHAGAQLGRRALSPGRRRRSSRCSPPRWSWARCSCCGSSPRPSR